MASSAATARSLQHQEQHTRRQYTGLGYLGTAGSNGIGIFVTNNVGNTTTVQTGNGSLGMVTVNGSPAPWIMTNNGGGGGGSFMAYTPPTV